MSRTTLGAVFAAGRQSCDRCGTQTRQCCEQVPTDKAALAAVIANWQRWKTVSPSPRHSAALTQLENTDVVWCSGHYLPLGIELPPLAEGLIMA